MKVTPEMQKFWEDNKVHLQKFLETMVLPKITIGIDEAVAKSETKIDDMVWVSLKPAIVAEIKNQISHI